ncbi:hypothetical protein [Singulisphaera sp. GP187]|uniref:hypothetical protein n=1 Tax=Singulisphaera sp. GP187 TaxID=1882752 RepID=UPI00116144B1|nr:hypothetical protein [Singulisphaera sp. GP187]
MKSDDPMSTADHSVRLAPEGMEAGGGSKCQPEPQRTMCGRAYRLIDGSFNYHDSASVVIISSGAGMSLAYLLGWPIELGFLAGFVPSFLIGAMVHTSRA